MQDRWLAIAAVRHHVERHAEDENITGSPGSPTLLVLLAAALLATVLLAWAWRGQRREHHYWRDHARDLRGELHRAGKVAASLAERVAGQAELLAKRAEKKEVPGE